LNIDFVITLCRSSGYTYQAPPQPNKLISDNNHLYLLEKYLESELGNRPRFVVEHFFSRFPVNDKVVRMIVAKIQADDIYIMEKAYPSPDHRSTALATQGCMLFIILFFIPEYLKSKKTSMREIVDKHFNDNWIIVVYMGCWVDLQIEWNGYPAAGAALGNTLEPSWIEEIQKSNTLSIHTAQQQIDKYLTKGLLTDSFLLDNTSTILETLRNANSSIRWLMLHRKTCNKIFYGYIVKAGIPVHVLMDLVLGTSHLEYLLKTKLKRLLQVKADTWETSRAQCATRMGELSEYFTGNIALTRVARDDSLVEWFAKIKMEVESLEYSNPTMIGRRIQKVIRALEEVEQYNEIDTSLQIKQFLSDSRQLLLQMVRVVNLQESLLTNIDIISDMSYAWELMDDYRHVLQLRIQEHPHSVYLLRALFLKLASILDSPLVRISQVGSSDTVSVAAHYSNELVKYVRNVLEVIPKSMFDVLVRIIELQTTKLRPLPTRLETSKLHEAEQSDLRFDLAKMTFQVSMFTEGILAMQKTLLGILELDPKQILEDGIRKELVTRITRSLDKCLNFSSNEKKKALSQQVSERLSVLLGEMRSFKGSFEYIQDYININGLKVWQGEYSRVLNYFVEQECNTYTKSKVSDFKSKYQSRSIPIPRMFDRQGHSFLGRLEHVLLQLTSASGSIYVPEWAAWFDRTNNQIELAGPVLFSLLKDALGVHGVHGLNTLFSFRIQHQLRKVIGGYSRLMEDSLIRKVLQEFAKEISSSNIHGMLQEVHSLLDKTNGEVSGLCAAVIELGQLQLLLHRNGIELAFDARTSSGMLFNALVACNDSTIAEIRQSGKLSNEAVKTRDLLERCGISSPFKKVYLTCEPCAYLPELLFVVVKSMLAQMKYDPVLGTLIDTKWDSKVDGIPLIVGVSTLLKQFHPQYTSKFLSRMSAFIRAVIIETFSASHKNPESYYSNDILNSLQFMHQFAIYAEIPADEMESFIPSHVYESIISHHQN